MAKYGDREREFSNLINEYFPNSLKGKLAFGKIGDVYVSVDNSIELDKKIILIEIDASNQAKLVAGQYTLLNLLINKQTEKSKKIINIHQSKKKILFYVVHCYGTAENNNLYSSGRSKRNFKLIQDNCFSSNNIAFKSIHIDELKKELITEKVTLEKLFD